MGKLFIGGKGTGKTAFSDIIIDNVIDGDLDTKMKDIPYSTSLREIITVEDMLKHSIRRGDFL